eukprot:CAMPEP_0172634680 /NCGR_PEP_ID=MMETSP1068-20121228/195721_1 /TAXON_ID=35684 /ORGANISM="Pseudopedinella elastica, Strain CCMP716" /LENGTH=124 /DNA_ID=CAMNT_0013446665 /DNA_START=19 /DNA_END=390 /DNA_ORIENTATION=+
MKPPPFQLNPRTVWAAPVEPHRLDRRFIEDSTYDTFKRYDKDNNGTMDVNELKFVLADMQMKLSDANIMKLQVEMDTDGDGLVTIKEAADWWDRKQNKMKDTLFADPTKKWGDSPATTSREVGW